jgi:predicted transposase/invertase (TIGR01784 family)
MKGRDYLISAEEKGKAEGKAERDIEITRRMLLKGKNIEEIIDITDLSVEEIKEIEAKIKS